MKNHDTVVSILRTLARRRMPFPSAGKVKKKSKSLLDRHAAFCSLGAVVRLGAGNPSWNRLGEARGTTEITGTFGFLAFDTIPDYLDTAPLPAPGSSAVWEIQNLLPPR